MDGGKSLLNEKTLGKKLQRARQEAGLTQQGLCAKANLSYSTLAKIERGAIKAPSIFTIEAIANAINISLDQLVGHQTNKINYKRTKSGIEFIYFDLNGCLIRFAERAFSLIAKNYAISTDTIEAILWRNNDDLNRGKMSIDEFDKLFSEKLNIQHFSWIDYYLKAIEAVPSLINLMTWAAENYHIGIMTNSMPGVFNKVLESGLIPKLNYDVIIDSSETGFIKPEPEAYQIATSRAGFPEDKILLIDDTKANLIAAEKLNWKIMWFDYARPEDLSAEIRSNLEPAN